MIAALQNVPSGSTVLVSANSGNLYAIMAGLGVPVGGCGVDSDNCLPCKKKKCFPKKDFNHLWKVLRNHDGSVFMSHSTYGN